MFAIAASGCTEQKLRKAKLPQHQILKALAKPQPEVTLGKSDLLPMRFLVASCKRSPRSALLAPVYPDASKLTSSDRRQANAEWLREDHGHAGDPR